MSKSGQRCRCDRFARRHATLNRDTNPSAATVQKIVSEILPPTAGVAFAKDARDLLIECCVEFITLISSEANEISEKEAKKTIACDHITKALEQLGFSDYVPAVMEAAAEHKETQKVVIAPATPFATKTSTDALIRDARKSRTSSLTAACQWKSSHGYRRSSLPRRGRGTLEPRVRARDGHSVCWALLGVNHSRGSVVVCRTRGICWSADSGDIQQRFTVTFQVYSSRQRLHRAVLWTPGANGRILELLHHQ